MYRIIKKSEQKSLVPEWSWGDSTLDIGQKELNWYESYVFLASAKRDAADLASKGYEVVVVEGSTIDGWALYYSGNKAKHSFPPF